jgi:ActR/RegA family two-component response regulator
MMLKSLLLSSDERTVRVLRRVLSDLEIAVEHCSASEDAVRNITRHRFEAIIVDCSNAEESGNVIRASKAAPVNKRALSIVLVDAVGGLKAGFEMGAHFVLHKPLAVERAKASFRAVRALMKSERRLQMRIPVQIPVACVGARQYQAKTIDLCEGGMALHFVGRVAKEASLRFSLELPGTAKKLEVWGELAWEGDGERAGVRFNNISDSQRKTLRDWMHKQIPECEPDDPPVLSRLSNLSQGACYVTTGSPFPKSTRVILYVPTPASEVRAAGVVRVVHPEYGMGIEFLQATTEQRDQVVRILEILRAGEELPDIHIEPDGLEPISVEDNSGSPHDDSLVHLFQQHAQASVEVFLQQMQQCTLQESRS